MGALDDVLAALVQYPELNTWGTPVDYSILVRQDQPVGSGSSQYKVETLAIPASSMLSRLASGDIVARTFAQVLSDIGAGTAAAVALNTTHRSSDGSDHSFIDQDVTAGATVAFGIVNATTVRGNPTLALQAASADCLLLANLASGTPNVLAIFNASTGGSPTIASGGVDANSDITLSPAGTGEVVIAGGLNVGANPITSTVATGTAPLTVASTTMVANLNASLLEGNAATAFATASHNHAASDVNSGLLALARGGLNADVSTWASKFVFFSGGVTFSIGQTGIGGSVVRASAPTLTSPVFSVSASLEYAAKLYFNGTKNYIWGSSKDDLNLQAGLYMELKAKTHVDIMVNTTDRVRITGTEMDASTIAGKFDTLKTDGVSATQGALWLKEQSVEPTVQAGYGLVYADDEPQLRYKGSDDVVRKISQRKQFISIAAPSTVIGNWQVQKVGITKSIYFAFEIPDDVAGIESISLRYIPQHTASLLWQGDVAWGTNGDAYNLNTATDTGNTEGAQVVNDINELLFDFGLGFTPSAGDMVTVKWTNNATLTQDVGVLGLAIEYN